MLLQGLTHGGYSLEGEAKEIMKRGCDAFIQKPFNLDQLSRKIGEVLDSMCVTSLQHAEKFRLTALAVARGGSLSESCIKMGP
jgi:FixJ family two-component response regulator